MWPPFKQEFNLKYSIKGVKYGDHNVKMSYWTNDNSLMDTGPV